MTVHRLEDRTHTLIRTEEEERPAAAPCHTAALKRLNQTGAAVVLCYVMNSSVQRTHSATVTTVTVTFPDMNLSRFEFGVLGFYSGENVAFLDSHLPQHLGEVQQHQRGQSRDAGPVGSHSGSGPTQVKHLLPVIKLRIQL